VGPMVGVYPSLVFKVNLIDNGGTGVHGPQGCNPTVGSRSGAASGVPLVALYMLARAYLVRVQH
jgi:hypothetical protein